ncbi:MAG: hypothetical protein HWQ58_13015 [Nostoc sp. LPT]|nr:hypothetical protein [Nostoc sp. LPT]
MSSNIYDLHQNRVQEEAEYLASLEHSIIYTGSIGVGKTIGIIGYAGVTKMGMFYRLEMNELPKPNNAPNY